MFGTKCLRCKGLMRFKYTVKRPLVRIPDLMTYLFNWQVCINQKAARLLHPLFLHIFRYRFTIATFKQPAEVGRIIKGFVSKLLKRQPPKAIIVNIFNNFRRQAPLAHRIPFPVIHLPEHFCKQYLHVAV